MCSIVQGRWAQDVAAIVAGIKHLQGSRVQAYLLASAIACGSSGPSFRTTIKPVSYDGALAVRGNLVDAGNIAYTIVFLGMWHLGTNSVDAGELNIQPWVPTKLLINFLAEMFPSLQASCISNHAYEKRGDIIEFCLAMWWRPHEEVFPQTGPQIFTIQERRDWFDHMHSACLATQRLLRGGALPRDRTPSQQLRAIAVGYQAHKNVVGFRSGKQRYEQRILHYGAELEQALNSASLV